MMARRSRAEKAGAGLMAAGFLILLGSGVGLILARNGTFPMGELGRHFLVLGLGTYFIGRVMYWRARRRRHEYGER